MSRVAIGKMEDGIEAIQLGTGNPLEQEWIDSNYIRKVEDENGNVSYDLLKSGYSLGGVGSIKSGDYVEYTEPFQPTRMYPWKKEVFEKLMFSKGDNHYINNGMVEFWQLGDDKSDVIKGFFESGELEYNPEFISQGRDKTKPAGLLKHAGNYSTYVRSNGVVVVDERSDGSYGFHLEEELVFNSEYVEISDGHFLQISKTLEGKSERLGYNVRIISPYEAFNGDDYPEIIEMRGIQQLLDESSVKDKQSRGNRAESELSDVDSKSDEEDSEKKKDAGDFGDE